MTLRMALVLGLSLLGSAPLTAHHFFVSRYDASSALLLKGVVTRIEWTNPHSHVTVDVKNAGGTVTWVCEGGSPGTLDREGLKRSDLRVGDTITIDAYPAKDGSHAAVIRRIILPNGRTIVAPLAGADR
jgi:Family of unknown function (DUF6152)